MYRSFYFSANGDIQSLASKAGAEILSQIADLEELGAEW